MDLDGGQLVVEMLKAYNVRYVFGVPGDTGLSFYDALRAAQDETRAALAQLADEFSRVTSSSALSVLVQGQIVNILLDG
ncbi:MAG: thiamine pyrophosphate-binding protein [Anaerolineae bacterium]